MRAFPEWHAARVNRTVRVGAALLVVVLTATGCGFLDAMAHPDQQDDAGASPAAVPSAEPAPAPPSPVVVARADLQGGGTLQVTVDPVVTGLVLPFEQFFEDCLVHGPSLQYVPVTFEYAVAGEAQPGLAAHLTVTPGPATPADIGDVGVFFAPTWGHDVYCQHYPPLPTTDTFWSHGGPNRVTGYVVLDRAVTPAAPQGRAEVFPTLQARIDHLRLKDADTGAEHRLALGAVEIGAACPDDPSALCVPLG